MILPEFLLKIIRLDHLLCLSRKEGCGRQTLFATCGREGGPASADRVSHGPLTFLNLKILIPSKYLLLRLI